MTAAPHRSDDPVPDPAARRAMLTVRPNPGERLDYRVTLQEPLAAAAPSGEVSWVRLDYVPDRLLLRPDGFARYVAGLGRFPWPALEALGLAILDDINNEAVPRWVRVTVSAGPDGIDGSNGPARAPGHAVTLEDRQPHWPEGAGPGPGSGT